MRTYKREITKEIYDNAMNNRGYITASDESKVFTISELCGYGVYGTKVFTDNGKYYVRYDMGSTCD